MWVADPAEEAIMFSIPKTQGPRWETLLGKEVSCMRICFNVISWFVKTRTRSMGTNQGGAAGNKKRHLLSKVPADFSLSEP